MFTNVYSVYWLAKLHKNLIKARLIIAALKYSLTPLSKSVTSVFKLSFKEIEGYKKQTFFFSGINPFWRILNNQPVIDN